MTEYNEIEHQAKDLDKKDEDKNEEREVKPVIVTKVKKQKKGLMERIVVGLLGPDGIPGITSYLGNEIVKPAIKNIIVDSITSGINMAMFGGEGHHRQNTPPGYTNTPQRPNVNYSTNYAKPYATNSQLAQTPKRPTPDRVTQVDEYIITTRNEAMEVLDSLTEQIMSYGSASVADYYDMLGVESSYTDHRYGWEDLSQALVTPTRGGYIIKMPRVQVV